jgi:zinc protease
MMKSARAITFGLTGLLLAAVVWAQPPALPDAAQILDRSIEVTGGRAAYERITSRVTSGTLELPAMGIKAKLRTYAAAPSFFYSIVESEAIGKIESGSNGEVFWDITAMTGPRIKTGEEKAAAVREGRFNNVLFWREMYKEVQTAGIDTVESRPCYRLVLTPNEGEPETNFYDVETGLPQRADQVIVAEMGRMSVQSFFADYRPVDGLLIPFKSRQILMGMQEMVFETDSIAQNVQIPPERFALPPEIQALVAKAAGGETAPK